MSTYRFASLQDQERTRPTSYDGGTTLTCIEATLAGVDTFVQYVNRQEKTTGLQLGRGAGPSGCGGRRYRPGMHGPATHARRHRGSPAPWTELASSGARR